MQLTPRQTVDGKTVFINLDNVCYKVNDPYPVELPDGTTAFSETLWFSNGQRFSFLIEESGQVNESDAK